MFICHHDLGFVLPQREKWSWRWAEDNDLGFSNRMGLSAFGLWERSFEWGMGQCYKVWGEIGLYLVHRQCGLCLSKWISKTYLGRPHTRPITWVHPCGHHHVSFSLLISFPPSEPSAAPSILFFLFHFFSKPHQTLENSIIGRHQLIALIVHSPHIPFCMFSWLADPPTFKFISVWAPLGKILIPSFNMWLGSLCSSQI